MKIRQFEKRNDHWFTTEKYICYVNLPMKDESM